MLHHAIALYKMYQKLQHCTDIVTVNSCVEIFFLVSYDTVDTRKNDFCSMLVNLSTMPTAPGGSRHSFLSLSPYPHQGKNNSRLISLVTCPWGDPDFHRTTMLICQCDPGVTLIPVIPFCRMQNDRGRDAQAWWANKGTLFHSYRWWLAQYIRFICWHGCARQWYKLLLMRPSQEKYYCVLGMEKIEVLGGIYNF